MQAWPADQTRLVKWFSLALDLKLAELEQQSLLPSPGHHPVGWSLSGLSAAAHCPSAER